MDTRNCAVCGRPFDFDKGGLGRDGDPDYVVCSVRCAKRSAASRGHAFAIHDELDRILETNATPEQLEGEF